MEGKDTNNKGCSTITFYLAKTFYFKEINHIYVEDHNHVDVNEHNDVEMKVALFPSYNQISYQLRLNSMDNQ